MMRRYLKNLVFIICLVTGLLGLSIGTISSRSLALSGPATQFAAGCTTFDKFLTFDPWYYYLPCPNGEPAITQLSDLWLIVFALVDDAVSVAAFVAVGFIIWGGFTYITSQGNAGAVSKALSTIISAIIGLAIAIFSIVGVQYVAGIFSNSNSSTVTGPYNGNQQTQTKTLTIPQQ